MRERGLESVLCRHLPGQHGDTEHETLVTVTVRMTQESGSSPPVEDQESRRQESKERRRRERRERRARRQRQRQSDLYGGMEGYMYSDTCHVLPDILNSHVPPPPYTTLPRHVAEAGTRGSASNRSGGTWRAALTGFSRR